MNISHTEISRSIYRMLFLNTSYLQLSCLGSEFQHYSIDCKCQHHRITRMLELKVCSYCLNAGQDQLNVALTM